MRWPSNNICTLNRLLETTGEISARSFPSEKSHTERYKGQAFCGGTSPWILPLLICLLNSWSLYSLHLLCHITLTPFNSFSSMKYEHILSIPSGYTLLNIYSYPISVMQWKPSQSNHTILIQPYVWSCPFISSRMVTQHGDSTVRLHCTIPTWSLASELCKLPSPHNYPRCLYLI